MRTHIANLSTEQNERPLGIRIVEPPADTRQAVRGNLYAVVEAAHNNSAGNDSAGNDSATAQLVEQALSVIQRTYYTLKGTQTFVLTEALREAIQLFEDATTYGPSTTNQSNVPGILLLTMINGRITAMSAGAALALITSGDSVDVYPPYTSDTKQDLYESSDIYRQDIAQGGAFFLAGQRALAHFTLRELASIVAYVTEDNVADVAADLREQAGADRLAGLIAVVEPLIDTTTTQTLPATGSAYSSQQVPSTTSVGSARMQAARGRGSALPAALSTKPPVRTIASDTASMAMPSEPASMHGLQSDGSRSVQAAASTASANPYPTDPSIQYDDEPGATHLYYEQATGEQLYGGADRGRAEGDHSTPRTIGASLRKNFQRAQRFLGIVLLGAEFTKPREAESRAYAGTVPNEDQDYTQDDAGWAPTTRRQTDLTTPMVAPNEDIGTLHETPYDNVGYDSTGIDQRAGIDQRYEEWEPSDPYESQHYAEMQTRSAIAQDAAQEYPQEHRLPSQRPLSAEMDVMASPTPSATPNSRGQAAPQATAPVPKRAMGRRARIFSLAALSILLLTVVIVASVFWTTGRQNIAEAERLLDGAEASFLSAQSALDIDDKSTARLKLTEAQGLITEANTLIGTRIERADQLTARIEQELAGLLQIRPLQALALPLVRFPAEAQPQRIIVSDQDLYILDTGRQLVQYFEMDPTRNFVSNPEGEIILAQGDVIDGTAAGRLIDMTWLPPIAGVQDKSYLLILDSNRNIFQYERRVEGVSLLPLGGREELQNPAFLRVYGDRLYVADAGTNQIYRYERGDFGGEPGRWLSAQAESNLSSLRSMAIDGDIWLLYTQGVVQRYRTGNPVQFSLESSFGQIQNPVDLAVGNQSNSMLYVADGSGERILVFDKNGAYQRQLRAPEGDTLRNLRGIWVDEVAGTMYLLTQSSLFNHPLPN